MKFLHRLDKIRKTRTQLSRAKWLREAGVPESCWYRWTKGQNSPTLELVERLLTPLSSEIAIIWTPPNGWKSPKQKGCAMCKAKKNEKNLKKC
jgi:hypothetical protein